MGSPKRQAGAGRPTSVRLFGFDWPVTWTAEALRELEARANGQEMAYGVASFEFHRIGMEPARTEAAVKLTFVHEVLHVAARLSGTAIAIIQADNDDKEEALVTALSPSLLAFLRDNPHVLEWLMADDEGEAET